jgi:hypothetical protein
MLDRVCWTEAVIGEQARQLGCGEGVCFTHLRYEKLLARGKRGS